MTYQDVEKTFRKFICDIIIDYKTNEATVILKEGGGFVASCPQAAYDYLGLMHRVRRGLSN